MSNTEQQIEAVLKDSLKEIGVTLERTPKHMAASLARGSARLALLVDQPGFDHAAIAVRDVIALESGLEAVNAADEVRGKVLGMIQTILFIFARITAPTP
jgi:hypothetical protein